MLDGVIILSMVLLTAGSQLIGLLTKYKIFLIFSVGGYITLLVQFQDFTGLVIGLVGVILFNLYMAFHGND